MMGQHEENESKEISNTFCVNEEVKVIDGPFNGFKVQLSPSMKPNKELKLVYLSLVENRL